ncbi:UDP-N-acetylglucosamine--undecaprenyl-phosphate N-acetylglucosaminephosphotransferase [Enterovibrio norvegicus]|uniref:Undecaprenyl-phosphate alpha-N-acetylglucosaminyl 1-phosphate transferase n=1 Tax=Enterovibrio norvegicus DSM 15893 TaxID=1121869 RepID=A0A1I5S6M3_9GAMM|nr:UDP-N-acetylglucosamine--undecaprenyl-phosphate N-acetylglucosaminephosphotransferase [Enterovibrio norvegicus]SFP66413.1 UDP-GlcNAc:undecaprenyl-phosphate GlcNAc-1-phosphate transferase [Enterovibrio norvegicus DSM 15893]
MFTSIIASFLLSFFLLFIFRKLAKNIGLVDKPSTCKQHVGEIPVIGGLAVFTAIYLSSQIFASESFGEGIYLNVGWILIFIGMLDDKYDISYKFRLLAQVILSLCVITYSDLSLDSLGGIAGDTFLELPMWASYSISVLAIIGAINAFNMVDGIDGLLGGLASVSFAALAIMFWLNGDTSIAMNCVMFIAALIPYILLNLGIPLGQRFKIFMGDAGSMLIGFTVVWFLIRASQNDHIDAIRPVAALWFIALPLMDMTTIMVRRVRKGQSPCKPDREHLHHICQRVGLSSRMTLVFICSLASFFAAIGVFGELYAVSETIMFMAFLVLFAVYFSVISHIFRITTKVRALMGKSALFEEVA